MGHLRDKNDPCIFCELDRPILAESEHALAFLDSFPISKGHTLVVPRRHVRTILDTDADEFTACFELARTVCDLLQLEHAPDGFNIGVNCETAAGQSVWHAHIHVIPRYAGDVDDPLGGVRNVIPLKEKN
jgi:diadenosine tetraphosphate (Ap4A) HIT family hydrolase